jgi:hypothetical protein
MNSHIITSSIFETKSNGNYLQSNNIRGNINNNNGLINSKIQKSNSKNPFLTTPSAKEKLLKLEEEEKKEYQEDKIFNNKVNFPIGNYKEENILFNSNFFSENSSLLKQVKFSGNSCEGTQLRFLCSEGEVPNIKHADSKPSLNRLESLNNLIAYSKGKYFAEDSSNNNLNYALINLHNQLIQNKEDATEEEIEEQEQNCHEEKEVVKTDPYIARLLELQKNLSVPIDRKDDEKFKILQMQKMKKESASAYKSTQIIDLHNPPHQINFQNGKINH